MTLDERLENVAVIGAAGKMGSGIAVLISQEMAIQKLKPENKDKIYRLNLIDVSEKALDGLRSYLRAQILKRAEKTTVLLREVYEDRKDLIENADIINAFVNDAYALLDFTIDLDVAKDAHLVFEAIFENEDIKIKILKKLKEICRDDTLVLTNTSSIPISYLDEKAGLDGRIIGYHFYNPPVIQRLVEVIAAKATTEELKNIASELGKRLRKKLVSSNDISGFIGNGHFSRDGLYALNEVERLKEKYGYHGAIYIMNKVSQDFLIRPMGIFQLIDYVGVDIFECLLRVMRTHLGDKSLISNLIDKMVNNKILGGQYPSGAQKDGFLKYENNRPVGVYNIERGKYYMFDEDWKAEIDKEINPTNEKFSPWRALLMDPKKQEKLGTHFDNLESMDIWGAELALNYLKETKKIAEKLLSDGVADSTDDINAVLTNGFYWLYGPINDYV
ncbi:MAG: 3-hydroxyacyl-CoA dehydrogenase family protein [Candidatus Cloacimonetes bacterium]|nr:3-hydroxyacyl-CoA dehydrogenase family protein [Candidatus Cloacimonadota bacterium]